MSLAALEPLLTKAEAVYREAVAVTGARHCCVVGTAGTGRSTLFERLKELFQCEAIAAELPGDGGDRFIHLVCQLAVQIPDFPWDQLSSSRKSEEQIALLLAALSQSRRPVILQVPLPFPEDKLQREPLPSEDALRGLIGRMVEELPCPLVLISDRYWPIFLSHFRLDEMGSRREALEATFEGPLRKSASILANFDLEWSKINPIAVRLAVGCLYLGISRVKIADTLKYSLPKQTIKTLATELTDGMVKEDPKATHKILSLILSRYPLALNYLRSLEPSERLPLEFFTQALGYGTQEIRFTEFVRDSLKKQWNREDAAAGHDSLASYYEACDGKPNPQAAGVTQVLPWLEALHHLSWGSAESQDRWRQRAAAVGWAQDVQWERARALSRLRMFPEAAAIYRDSLNQVEHPYARHYLGFNLCRARLEHRQVEDSYRQALVCEPLNPLWNSRLIQFLVLRARFVEAEEQFQFIWPRLAQNAPACVQYFLSPVLESFVRHGRPSAAARLLDYARSNKSFGVSLSPEFRQLEQLVGDAVEVELLGAAVYPFKYPLEDRWKLPYELAVRNLGETDTWYASAVRESTYSTVKIVGARKVGEDFEVLEQEFTADTWELATGERSIDAQGHYFLCLQNAANPFIVLMQGYSRQGFWQQRGHDKPPRLFWGLS